MSESIKLDEQETADVVEVLKSRQAGSKKSPKNPYKKDQRQKNYNKSSKPKQVQDAQAEVKKAFNEMKKLLKPRSKHELIELIWTYGAQLQEMQFAAQQLLEENKKLKGLETSND
jgi:hypothetical protein